MIHFGKLRLWQAPMGLWVYSFYEANPCPGERYNVVNYDTRQPLPFTPGTDVVACQLTNVNGRGPYADASTMRLATAAANYVRGRIIGYSYI